MTMATLDHGRFDVLDSLIDRLPLSLCSAPDHGFVPDAISRDPYAMLGPLRDSCGVVHRGPEGDYGGVTIYNAFGHDLTRPHAMALSFAAVSAIAMDPRRFRNSTAYGVHEEVQGSTVNTLDGVGHRPVRQMLDNSVFGRKPMEIWVREVVEPTAEYLVRRLADRLRRGAVADIRGEILLPLAFGAIGTIIGVPMSGLEYFVKAGELAQSGPRHRQAAEDAVAGLNDWFRAQVAERKRAPANDLMSLMLSAQAGDRRFSDAEVVDNCRFLLPAGIETTMRQSANILYALMTHPDQYAAMVADPTLIDPAIEEGCRWMPSANIIPRIAAEDAEVAGVPIAAGTAILNMLGIANRDPDRWADADHFDIRREPKRHMTFHVGIHHCIGNILARASFRAILQQCAIHLPGMKLAVDPSEIGTQGFVIRCPDALPVTLN